MNGVGRFLLGRRHSRLAIRAIPPGTADMPGRCEPNCLARNRCVTPPCVFGNSGEKCSCHLFVPACGFSFVRTAIACARSSSCSIKYPTPRLLTSIYRTVFLSFIGSMPIFGRSAEDFLTCLTQPNPTYFKLAEATVNRSNNDDQPCPDRRASRGRSTRFQR